MPETKSKPRSASRGHSALSHFPDPHDKKAEPRLPISFGSDLHEQVEILRPVLFEVKAEIKKWVAKDSFMAEEERDQKPSDSPVAVEKWMDCLELNVR